MPDLIVDVTETVVRVETVQAPQTVVVATGTPGPPGPPGDTAALQAHIDDPTPHPAYDDGIDNEFVIYFENGAS